MNMIHMNVLYSTLLNNGFTNLTLNLMKNKAKQINIQQKRNQQ